MVGGVSLPPLVEVVHAEEVPVIETPIEWTPETVEELVRQKARKYGVDEHALAATISCESMGFTWNDQSLVIQKDGTREPSYGYAQFYIPSGLTTASGDEITKKIALDPEAALDAAAWNFSQGNASHWTCFRKYQAGLL